MEIQKLIINDSNSKAKRAKAEFYIKGKKKPLIRRFGSPNAYTYFDGASEEKRKNYIARHSKNNEDWNNIMTAGALSYYVLWQTTNKQKIEKLINRKFNIPIVKVKISKNKAN